MAATITAEVARWVTRDVIGAVAKQFAIYQVTLDSSYAADGEAVDFTALAPFSAVDAVCIIGVDVGPTAGYVVTYDNSAEKIVVFRQLDPADAGGADVALPEVAAAVDLSAVIVTMLVIGDE